MRRLLVALVAVACGGQGTASPPDKRDAAVTEAKPVQIPARPLGLASASAFGWRKGPGQTAFRDARRAEDKGDWAAVATACKRALAADAGHLEAAWLLAAAQGALDKPDEVLAPLLVAEAGDFGKWGPASLELPELAHFLATPTGQAWKKRVEADRVAYSAALARGLVVVADGDLYAVDIVDALPRGPAKPDDGRWYRLTRTYGAVVGALAIDNHTLVYVTRARIKKQSHFGIGQIDLGRGHTTRPTDVVTVGPLAVASSKAGIYVESERAHTAWTVDTDGKLKALPKPARPPGAWLEITGRTARLHRQPSDVTADFDEHALASQIRLDTSKRVVSVPSPGQIDGSTVVWSPDRSKLALVASLDERCTNKNAAAVFVVDAATGTLHEIARDGDGLAVDWVNDRAIAIASTKGVAVHDLDANKSFDISGASDLVAPRHFPRCTPVEPVDEDKETPPPEDPDEVVKP